jgi:hypothetical protein
MAGAPSLSGPDSISETAGKASYVVSCGETDVPLVGSVANTGALTVSVSPDATAADRGEPNPAVVTCVPGTTGTVATVEVPITDDTLDEGAEQFSVSVNGVLTGVLAPVSLSKTTTINDDDPLASIAELAFIVEPDSGTQAVELTVTLASAAAQTTTVPFDTDDLSATAGTDYTATAGELVFQPGETSKTVSVPVHGDTAPESAEAFFVNLLSTDNGSLSPTASQGSVGIFDNDKAPLPTVSLPGSVSVEEGNGAGNILFDVTLSSPATERTEVAWKTLEWTALNGRDYERGSGKVVFQPGQKSKTVSVDIIGDRRDEPDEAFAVSLENPVAATLGATKSSFGVIEDDDGPKVGIGKPRVRGKRLVTKVSCPESTTGCQGALTGKVGRRALRTARFDLEPGEGAKLRLKLSRAIRTALEEKARRAKLTATAADPSGDTLATTRRARLKRQR